MTTLSIEKLIACPFGCREHELVFTAQTDVRDGFEHGYTIFCPECGISMNDESRDQLVIRWNSRTYGQRDDIAGLIGKMMLGDQVSLQEMPEEWLVKLFAAADQIIQKMSPEMVDNPCEGCGKQVRAGDVVHFYEEVGEVHIDCARPTAISNDRKAMILAGEPFQRYPLALLLGTQHSGALCSDCPPTDYSTDETRCAVCPRRKPEAN